MGCYCSEIRAISTSRGGNRHSGTPWADGATPRLHDGPGLGALVGGGNDGWLVWTAVGCWRSAVGIGCKNVIDCWEPHRFALDCVMRIDDLIDHGGGVKHHGLARGVGNFLRGNKCRGIWFSVTTQIFQSLEKLSVLKWVLIRRRLVLLLI